MDFIFIWCDGRYRSKVLLSAIPTLERDLEVMVTEFSYICKSNFLLLSLYSYIIKTFYEFHVYLA